LRHYGRRNNKNTTALKSFYYIAVLLENSILICVLFPHEPTEEELQEFKLFNLNHHAWLGAKILSI
jgi:hypothetical protein